VCEAFCQEEPSNTWGSIDPARREEILITLKRTGKRYYFYYAITPDVQFERDQFTFLYAIVEAFNRALIDRGYS
jgi:hypothetical protein